MNDKKQRLTILIISILVLAIGISYAYYSAVVQGTGNANAEASGKTATIGEVEFNGENTFDTTNIGRDIYPGFIGVQELTISPYKDGTGIYEIDLAATVPEAFGDDIKLTIYKTSDKTNNNIESEEGTLTITNNQYTKQDILTINGVLEKVYEKPLINTELTILEQVDFKIENNTFTTPSATPDEYFTYYAVYEYLDNGNQNEQQGLDFSSKITVRYAAEANNLTNETLDYLASLNQNYVLSNSDKCLRTDGSGFIIDPNAKMSDEDTPIICSMKDDYGTSYYLRGLHTDNNVVFANSCWKIIRVTGTGGIKMIYNGDLDANGKCTTTSGTHNGFTGQTLSLSGNKVYGTSYTKEGNTYTLVDTSTMNWTNAADSIIGKYTCNNTTGTCTTLYAVTGKYSSTAAYVLKLNQSTNYAQIGTSAFNYYTSSTNSPQSMSLSYVGYMYNDIYPSKSTSRGPDILSSNKANTSNYYYGDTISYSNGYYYITNTDDSDVQQLDWASNYETNLVGKYTCKGTSKYNAKTIRCATAYRVVDTTEYLSGYMVSEILSGGRLAIGNINLASDYTFDGTNYTLVNPISITSFEWLMGNLRGNYPYAHYYYCENWNDTICTNITRISSYPDSGNLTGSSMNNNYYYGSSFTYDETNPTRPFTLTNTVQFYDLDEKDNYSQLNTHHYTCFYNVDNTCDKLYFVVRLLRSSLYYIELQGNETIDDAVAKMLHNDDINVKDSHIKGAIDWWYKNNILGTTAESKLEDTTFCNDRTINDIGGFKETGYLGYMDFIDYKYKYSLKCLHRNDAFTVSDTRHGNGALTYPVGLIGAAETNLAGNLNAMKTGAYYWSTGGNESSAFLVTGHAVGQNGNWNISEYIYVNSYGARPVLSLKKGTIFVDGGDGTPSNPFVVE